MDSQSLQPKREKDGPNQDRAQETAQTKEIVSHELDDSSDDDLVATVVHRAAPRPSPVTSAQPVPAGGPGPLRERRDRDARRRRSAMAMPQRGGRGQRIDRGAAAAEGARRVSRSRRRGVDHRRHVRPPTRRRA